MKTLSTLFALLLLACIGSCPAHADGTYYLFRHAEKQIDGTKDPHLTDQGHVRSDYLAHYLSAANISEIYSTDTYRTIETVKPLSDLLGVSVTLYDAAKLEEFAETLKTKSGNIVIVGHSNTTPTLASLLSDTNVDEIDESEYDNLYQIVIINRTARLNRLKMFPIKLSEVKVKKD